MKNKERKIKRNAWNKNRTTIEREKTKSWRKYCNLTIGLNLGTRYMFGSRKE